MQTLTHNYDSLFHRVASKKEVYSSRYNTTQNLVGQHTTTVTMTLH
jgi:hypothetical protein